MKKIHITSMMAGLALFGAIQLSACKSKTAKTDTDTTVVRDTPAAAPAPVTIAADDELTKGVKDATKDFPGVTAAVKDGEVTLTGDITRDKLQTLMMSLNSLHPKKINNQLTIKK